MRVIATHDMTADYTNVKALVNKINERKLIIASKYKEKKIRVEISRKNFVTSSYILL